MHCGFCLPACPTYSLWGEEMDSPRGRIHLVSQLLDGAPLTPAAGEHFDRCLGCMACMTACPSGVQYDQIIEAAREWTEAAGNRRSPAGPAAGPRGRVPSPRSPARRLGTARPARAARRWPPGARRRVGAEARRSLRDRLTREAIFALFPYPARLRAGDRAAAAAAADRGGPADRPDRPGRRASPRRRAGAAAGAARRPGRCRPGGSPSGWRPAAPRRAVVGMLTGCVQSVFFPRVNAATARVLAAEGCDVIIPRSQGCCGALSLHSGRAAEAVAVRAADDRDVRGGGRRRDRRQLGRLRVGDEGVRAAVRRLAGRGRRPGGGAVGQGPRPGGVPRRARPGRASGIRSRSGRPTTTPATWGTRSGSPRAPRALLRAIPGLELVELRDAGVCCGSAGVYNLLQPDAARELGSRKADSVVGLRRLAAHLRQPRLHAADLVRARARGVTLRTAHTAEILDASINGVPLG